MTKKEVVELRGAVKTHCNNIPGISVVHLPVIYCFAMELGAAKGRGWNDGLPQLARNMIEKYVRNGMKRGPLEEVVRRVFYVEPAKDVKPLDDPFGIKAITGFYPD